MPSLRAGMVLWRDYAHLRSVVAQRAIDKDGRATPWYTYPAIEFLAQLDFRDKAIFEYGCGMSTLFWARAAGRVVSVEDNEEWYDQIAKQVPGNCRLMLETDVARIPSAIERAGGDFDVIVVDGPARGGTRLKCCEAALPHLRAGGLVILDNSDWLPESARFLREHGLLEVDMTGFAPVCAHVQTTSLFFDRAFNIAPIGERQPSGGRGWRPDNWERPFLPLPGRSLDCEGERFGSVDNEDDVTLASGNALRRFLLFTYEGRDGQRGIAIIDRDRDRVLLARHLAGAPASQLAAEIERLRAMPWQTFARFVNAHANRRYVLDDVF
jgi:hypothetical protein